MPEDALTCFGVVFGNGCIGDGQTENNCHSDSFHGLRHVRSMKFFGRCGEAHLRPKNTGGLQTHLLFDAADESGVVSSFSICQ